MTNLADLLSPVPTQQEMEDAVFHFNVVLGRDYREGAPKAYAELQAQRRQSIARQTMEACAKLVCVSCKRGSSPLESHPNRGLVHIHGKGMDRLWNMSDCDAKPIHAALAQLEAK